MHFSPRPGDAVTARGTRWLVVDVRQYDDCRLLTLTGAAPPFAGIERRLLHPFDAIVSIDRPTIPRVVSAARWRAECCTAIAADTPPRSLRHARVAGIDLMAHQLEPALEVLAGRGTRVLLADDVGLGKTIQAGLILAELLGRACIERALVLTPAGLRDQWVHELSSRFAIEAAGVDAARARQLAATLPLGMNPWSTLPVVVASTDYVKRAEVLPAVSACRWDAVVVDEAHGTSGDSDRRAAVQRLASRASYVLLLTATPHSGDRSAFASLCDLGSTGNDPLLVFRRSRADVRAAHLRRVRALRIRPSPAERAMHAALARYGDAVRTERGGDACLALSVLHKRAFSSPWSLAQSVARRLTTIERGGMDTGAQQLALPLSDPDGERTNADLQPEWPGDLSLADPVRDRRLLAALLDTCRAAAGAERKLSALRRLLRRSHEKAIVFTEYRDTLRHVQRGLEGIAPIVTLHGGMTREERTGALGEFERGPRSVLLATDAAGEGLNLQRDCRLIVNLELPWNPIRLEQRIGRVDRIGQTRIVHAVHLVADGTGEMRILERLHARVARAQADVGAADPVGGCDEAGMARLIVAGEGADGTIPPAGDLPLPLPNLVMPDCRAAALAEAARLERARAIAAKGRNRPDAGRPLPEHAPLAVSARRTSLRRTLGTKALLVWRLSWEDPFGRTMESHLVGATIDGVPGQPSPAAMKTIVQELAARVAPAIESVSAEWRQAALAAIGALADARLARERAILAALGDASSEQFQPGLFDRRADRLHHLARQEAADVTRQLSDRIALAERTGAARRRLPVLLLAVLP